MNKEQAYERLELPVGSDLQTVRRKFAEMHNDYRMRIENAPTPRLKQTFESGLEELKEAYALLNESDSMDDSAELPRTERSFEQQERDSKAQQAPPPPPPQEEKHRPKEQAQPVYEAPPAKPKSNVGLIVGIAASTIVVLAGFYFLSNRASNLSSSAATADPGQDSIVWEAALAGSNATSYEHYLKQYPEGIFAQAATDSLTHLKGADYVATIVEEAKEQAPEIAAVTPTVETDQNSNASSSSSSAHTKALIQEGKNLVDKDQYKQAEAKLREALNAGDTDAVPYLAAALNGLKRYNEIIPLSDRYPTSKDHPRMQRYLGHLPYFGLGNIQKNFPNAFEWYTKSANGGDEVAQNNLAVMYRDGKGTTKNEAEAVKWYTKAANQGHANAQDNLGDMYRDGKGVTKNEAEAVKWYRKAAAQGHTSAQASMGRAYHYGLGIDKDFQQAENFYTQAAKNGNKWACERLIDLGYDIEKETKDYCKAKELYQKGIDLGKDGYAYYRLGMLHYYSGRCGGGGYAEAKRLWLIAFDKKEPTATSNLGFMYVGGFGVDVDYVQAEKYLLKSIEFGSNNGFPEYRLGHIYQKGGHGIVQNIEKANEYFAIAKKKGYTGS